MLMIQIFKLSMRNISLALFSLALKESPYLSHPPPIVSPCFLVVVVISTLALRASYSTLTPMAVYLNCALDTIKSPFLPRPCIIHVIPLISY